MALTVILLVARGNDNQIEEETNERIRVSTVGHPVDSDRGLRTDDPGTDTGIDSRTDPETEVTTYEETTVAAANTDDIDVDPVEPEPETEEIRSVEELADYVLNAGLDGPDREAFLGDRYDEVQAWIDTNYEAPTYVYTQVYEEPDYYYPSGDGLNPEDGINYYYGTLETYYNLDMSGVVDWMHDLGYEGDYWVRDDGVKMFGDYVMVAAEYDQYPKGSIVDTSLGTGMVCDTGEGGWNWFDIAVDWGN